MFKIKFNIFFLIIRKKPKKLSEIESKYVTRKQICVLFGRPVLKPRKPRKQRREVTKMVLNAVMATKIASKSPLFYRIACFSHKPTSKFNSNAVVRTVKFDRIGGYRSCYGSISTIPKAYGFNELGRPQIQFKKFGSDYFRVFAVSNGGSSGGNGGFGGSGGENSGDNAGGKGDGGQKFSFLSW